MTELVELRKLLALVIRKDREFGHDERKDDTKWTKLCTTTETGARQRQSRKQGRWGCGIVLRMVKTK